MSKVKMPLVLMLLLGAALIAAACGNDNSQDVGGNQLDVAPDPIELVYWYVSPADWTEETFMRTFGNPIKEQFPHITPKFMQQGTNFTLEDMITANEQVDVVFSSTGLTSRFTDVGMQYDVTELLKQINFDESHIEPALMESGRVLGGGVLYGLPVYNVPATMYYNKDIFDKFGVDYPRDGMTWDETLQLSARLSRSDDGKIYRGLGVSLGHLIHMNQFSLDLVNPATNRPDFSNDQWRAFFSNIERFYKYADIPAITRADLNLNRQRDAFFKGQTLGMWLALTNLHTSPELSDEFQWDIATFPSFPGTGQRGPQPYPTLFNVTATSNHKLDAIQTIAFLTNRDYQMQKSLDGELLTVLRDQDIRNSFGQGDSLYKGKNVSALLPSNYSPPANMTRYDSPVRSRLEQGLFNVITGEADINTALRVAQEEAHAHIETAESG